MSVSEWIDYVVGLYARLRMWFTSELSRSVDGGCESL